MDMQQYERLKFDLADILRIGTPRAMSYSSKLAADIRDLFSRLAEDRFNLVVIGRFSRGKSSLMNAILGMDRLPTGVVPLTSVITTVTYGSEERVVLHFIGSMLFSDIPLRDLVQNITERGNPGNIKGIRTVEVQLPADILRQGFHFIDTPGLGSSILENTRTTEEFLPEADAFMMVTSYDSPLSEEELRTLRIIHASGRRCFVVLNKQDSVTPDEAAEVRAHVTAQLADMFGEGAPLLHSVSARLGLAARQNHDEDGLAKSGLPALETALIDFLVNDKRRDFLLSMCDRIRDAVIAAGTADEVADRLDTIKRQLSGTANGRAVRSETLPGLVVAELAECEICRSVSDSLFNFLARFQGQMRSDPVVQAQHAACGGLCGRHAVQFEALAAPREICTGFAPVLERQAELLRCAAAQGGAPSVLREAVIDCLPTEETCPACQIAKDAVFKKVTAFSSAGYSRPRSVLCVPHLAAIIDVLPPEAAKAVLQRHAHILDQLAGDMRRFALKQDGGRRYLASKEELGAGRRGLRALLGDPNAGADPPLRHRRVNLVTLTRQSGRSADTEHAPAI